MMLERKEKENQQRICRSPRAAAGGAGPRLREEGKDGVDTGLLIRSDMDLPRDRRIKTSLFQGQWSRAWINTS